MLTFQQLILLNQLYLISQIVYNILGIIMGNIPEDPSRQYQISVSEWEINENDHGVSYINKLSRDEFYLVKRSQEEQIQAFRERAAFTFENTPRLIIHSITNPNICILVEHSNLQLHHLLDASSNSHTAHLISLRTLLKVLLNLKNKYGCFYLTSDMVRVRHSNSLMVWINSNFQECRVEFPLPSEGEEVMIGSACRFFEKYLPVGKLPWKVASIQEAVAKTEEAIKSGCFKTNNINHQPTNLVRLCPQIFHRLPNKQPYSKHHQRSGTMKADNLSKYSDETVNLRYNIYKTSPPKLLSNQPTYPNVPTPSHHFQKHPTNHPLKTQTHNSKLNPPHNPKKQPKHQKSNLAKRSTNSVDNPQKNNYAQKIDQSIQKEYKRSETDLYSSTNTVVLQRGDLPSPIRRNLRNQLSQLFKQ